MINEKSNWSIVPWGKCWEIFAEDLYDFRIDEIRITSLMIIDHS